MAVILRPVGDGAGAAILDAGGRVGEFSAAPVSHEVQRAVAEESVEGVRVHSLVAGEELAVPVGEVGVMLVAPGFVHGKAPLCFEIANLRHSAMIADTSRGTARERITPLVKE